MDSGCASERASTISDWLAHASSESAHSLLSASAFLETGAEAGQRRLQQLDGALLRARDGRHERDAREVQGRRERQRLVVRYRDDELVRHHHERVLVRRVELDCELGGGEAETVVCGSEDRRRVAERERVLEVAGRAGVPQVGAGEQRAHARGAPPDARVGPRLGDGRVEGGGVGREGLPVERGTHRERLQHAQGIGQRERREARAKGVVVDQRDSLLGSQRHLAADAVREVGERPEVALSRRSEQAHVRCLAGVERIDDTPEQLRAHTRGALGEAVGEPQHGGAHDLARSSGTGRHAVIGDQAPVVGIHLVGAHAYALAHADTGRDPVDAGAVDDHGRALDDSPRSLHARERIGGHLDALVTARDAYDLSEREPLAVQDHAHCGPVCRARLGAGRGRPRPGRVTRVPGRREAYDEGRC